MLFSQVLKRSRMEMQNAKRFHIPTPPTTAHKSRNRRYTSFPWHKKSATSF